MYMNILDGIGRHWLSWWKKTTEGGYEYFLIIEILSGTSEIFKSRNRSSVQAQTCYLQVYYDW